MSYSIIVDIGKPYEREIYYSDETYSIIHREDGPAVEWCDGSKEWWVNNVHHRINGPCAEWSDEEKWFAINGVFYEEEEYWAIIRLGAFA